MGLSLLNGRGGCIIRPDSSITNVKCIVRAILTRSLTAKILHFSSNYDSG